MSKEQIKTIINEWNKNDEFYNLEYPNHKEAFVAFMKEQGISLDPNFIFSDCGHPYVYDDEFPAMDSKISIPLLSLVVHVSAYHFGNWDFFFNSVEDMA